MVYLLAEMSVPMPAVAFLFSNKTWIHTNNFLVACLYSLS